MNGWHWLLHTWVILESTELDFRPQVCSWCFQPLIWVIGLHNGQLFQASIRELHCFVMQTHVMHHSSLTLTTWPIFQEIKFSGLILANILIEWASINIIIFNSEFRQDLSDKLMAILLRLETSKTRLHWRGILLPVSLLSLRVIKPNSILRAVLPFLRLLTRIRLDKFCFSLGRLWGKRFFHWPVWGIIEYWSNGRRLPQVLISPACCLHNFVSLDRFSRYSVCHYFIDPLYGFLYCRWS